MTRPVSQTTNTNTDFSILIATVNGSGSQSANMILARSLHRAGVPVGSKNIFPSNIAGLPTWFMIRVNARGFVGRRLRQEVVVARNADTLLKDRQSVAPGGYFFYDGDLKLTAEQSAGLGADDGVTVQPLPLRELTEKASDSLKIRKVLSNTVYVGILAELLKIPDEIVKQAIHDQFAGKESVVAVNYSALAVGREYARANFSDFKWRLPNPAKTANNIQPLLIDGNSAGALGAVVGGCTFMSWYPITPATSLAEAFQDMAAEAQPETRVAVLQSEDELSAIAMVLGAGWAGSRAMTATSGPGLSLMAEAAGLSYFAEIPAVIWDVQRAGPSTGLPTRTMQGDLTAAARLSHGDTEHVVLLPATPRECYEFAELAFDLAEELQTLVVVLSDLDLGMNLFMSEELHLPKTEYRRGKVLDASKVRELAEFERYRDVDGDGIPYRTLPGTPAAQAAYFTRGSGHTEKATYSEDGANYATLLTRLKQKFARNHHLLPKPALTGDPRGADIGLVHFGSTAQIIPELCDALKTGGLSVSALQIRALPLTAEIGDYLKSSKKVVVVEQNRDAQMLQLLREAFPEAAAKMSSALQFDGMPIAVETILESVWK